jgi:hypothetical protein
LHKEVEEGDGNCRRLLLPLFLTLHKKEEEEEGDGVAAVAFFMDLHCTAAPQQEEEGNGKWLPSPSSWSCAAP